MSVQWAEALAEIANRLNRGRIDWMLVGSAATALRGVAIDPGDIDIAVATAEDVAKAAKLLPTPDSPRFGEPRYESTGPALWTSTTAEPTLRFGDTARWTFGRWWVHGVKVELAHIDDQAASHLMIETRSPLVWRERSVVKWHGHRVPTVPIEVQLATMIARQQKARIEATVTSADWHLLNVALLRRAIADRQSEGLTMTVPQQLQRLLAKEQGQRMTGHPTTGVDGCEECT